MKYLLLAFSVVLVIVVLAAWVLNLASSDPVQQIEPKRERQNQLVEYRQTEPRTEITRPESLREQAEEVTDSEPGGFLMMEPDIEDLEILPAGVVLQEHFWVQGTERITVLYEDGRVIMDGGLANTSANGRLTAEQIAKVRAALADASVQKPSYFEPKPGVMYESTYSMYIRTSVGVVEHQTLSGVLEEVRKLLYEAVL